jgi:hypothetical protein
LPKSICEILEELNLFYGITIARRFVGGLGLTIFVHKTVLDGKDSIPAALVATTTKYCPTFAGKVASVIVIAFVRPKLGRLCVNILEDAPQYKRYPVTRGSGECPHSNVTLLTLYATNIADMVARIFFIV